MMGHIGFGDVSSYIAHAFHMPMFFFVSGLLYHNYGDNMKEWFCRKGKALLVPYFLFGIFNYFIWMLIQMQKGEGINLSPIWHLLFVNTTGLASGSLWFLTALFITDLFVWLIERFIKKVYLKVVIVFFISHIGIICAQFLPFRLPYAMDAGMVGVGLFYIGYLLKKNKDKKYIAHLFQLSVWEIIIGILVFSFLILQNGEINMRKGLYYNVALFWINAIAGSILIYNLAVQIDKIRKWGSVLKNGVNLLEGIGRNSLIYVCLNDLLNVEVMLLLNMVFTVKSKWITVFTHSATLLIVIAVIEMIIRYTPIMNLLNLKIRNQTSQLSRGKSDTI